MQATTVNGFKVDRFVWTDSKGRSRTVSLKRQGEGNAGNGGYAVQMTYQYLNNGVWTTLVANPPSSGEGFGYFVSHERYRNFSDGSSATIAGKIFAKDDSPLGRGFPVTRRLYTGTSSHAGIMYVMNYPRYGTVAQRPVNASGQDSPPLPTTAASYALYNLEIRISWFFQDGRDYPRITTRINMNNVNLADRVSFDVRGPYGELKFDGNLNSPLRYVRWGDRYHFSTLDMPLTRNSKWQWNNLNAGARYTSLVASTFEMGLVEPAPFTQTRLRDGYAAARGKIHTNFNNGNGCPGQNQLLPCDWEWPYQSAQYSLPYNNPNGTTTGKKIAWGSSAFYGTGPSLPLVYDSPTTSQPFQGFPASKAISYDTCVVLGKFIAGGLTKSVAAAGGNYNCASPM